MTSNAKKAPEVKSKKYHLRDQFSLEIKGEVVVGPADIELTDEQAELEKHKLEPIKEKAK